MSVISVVNKYKHTPTPQDFPIHRFPIHRAIHRENPGFGNPFKATDFVNDRNVVVALYKRHFLEILPKMDKSLRVIKESTLDVNLVCFCAPLSCHGDIIKEYVEFARLVPSGVSPIVLFRELYNYRSPVLTEGTDHINVYSGSNLPLGRMLSNFHRSPFELEGYGKFESMEGFWFYLATGCEDTRFKTLWGAEAKAEGKRAAKKYVEGFDDIIDRAVRAKLDQNPEITNLLKETNLPFEHYYWYGTPENALILRTGHRFLETIQDYRSRLIGGKKTIIAGSRDIHDLDLVKNAIIDSNFKISSVVTGMAKGVDIIGYEWAKSHYFDTDEFPVTKEQWDKSKAAGHIRNAEMEKIADQAIIIIKANSKGSEGMLSLMTKANKPVHVVRID